MFYIIRSDGVSVMQKCKIHTICITIFYADNCCEFIYFKCKELKRITINI